MTETIDSMSCYKCSGVMESIDFGDWVCDKCGHTEEYVCVRCGSPDLQTFHDIDGLFGICMSCNNLWMICSAVEE